MPGVCLACSMTSVYVANVIGVKFGTLPLISYSVSLMKRAQAVVPFVWEIEYPDFLLEPNCRAWCLSWLDYLHSRVGRLPFCFESHPLVEGIEHVDPWWT